MATTIQDILAQFRAMAPEERTKGKWFEKLIQQYLLTDPQYAEALEEVWMWADWPYAWDQQDMGIDLVAKTRDTGEYWAIQCKFYAEDQHIDVKHIDRFLSESGKRFKVEKAQHRFVARLLIATTDKWGANAEKAIQNQTPEVIRLFFQQLTESPIDWSAFSIPHPEKIRLQRKKVLREDQKEAIAAIRKGFKKHDRGKLIMACGTGKTLTSLRLMEQMVPQGGRVLFLAPSISLISQNLRAWTSDAESPIHAFVVCSDSKVGKDEEDMRLEDLGYPASTDVDLLVQALGKVSPGRRVVIFATYQSIDTVITAQNQGIGTFDLVICDEAHRTTGITLPTDKHGASNFVKVHQNHLLQSKKRLYMTATPRIYALGKEDGNGKGQTGEKVREKAQTLNATVYSMDDEALYGPEFYRMGFGKAVDQDLLAEYKVLIVAVDETRMAALTNAYDNAYRLDDQKGIDLHFAAKVIGSWKGLSKQGILSDDGQAPLLATDPQPMKRAVAFSKSINGSKQLIEVFDKLVAMYRQQHPEDGQNDSPMVDCTLQHVDGTHNALTRLKRLEWLKAEPKRGGCHILSNARCLSEGVDVPALDAVVFFDTRESMVDIVQSVGRVMRKSRETDKKYGYIILPVCMPLSESLDYDDYVSKNPQFKGIWKVIRALRAHDESLVDEAEFKRKIKVIRGDSKGGEGPWGEQIPIDFPALPLDAISNAVYAIMPSKLGDREYWADWAQDIADMARRLETRFTDLLEKPKARKAFDRYLKGLQKSLNPAIREDAAIEMLVQQLLTRPIFDALFQGYAFTQENPVSKSLQAVLNVVDEHDLDSETEGLNRFYQNVRERVALAKSDKSRQDLIRNLYDTFFKAAFPKMAERLGIVYTPVEVVDFILQSADVALRRHFDTTLSARGVHILDPFVGTGTFLTRLLQSGLIAPKDLDRKYHHELHANELVLLAYYIADLNIESTYHALTGQHAPFPGIVLTDTFQMMEDDKQPSFETLMPENNERVERQRRQPIRVIVGNPPYSAQQGSQNDNNQNLGYPGLDSRIRETYANKSRASNVKNLYDSYIRAIRWATDRIHDQGIVAFVTNGSFLDANNMDGLRLALTEDYSHLYVLNLRGNQRTSGEESRKEGGKIFGSGSRTPVAITLMVKDPRHQGPCELHYHDIGDYLSREEKLGQLDDFTSIDGVAWERLQPNAQGDWAEQRNAEFESFLALGNKTDKSEAIFSLYSLGVGTNRDAWVCNFSRVALEANMRHMIAAYNQETRRYQERCKGPKSNQWPKVEDVIDADPRRISWTRSLKADVANGKQYEWEPPSNRLSLYRPFTRMWSYFNRQLNEYVFQMPRLFPTAGHENVVISATGIGATKAFSALATKTLPDLEMVSKGQCFPLYWYEKLESSTGPGQTNYLDAEGQSNQDGTVVQDGYVRRDAITDWALTTFWTHYQDESLTKEDIFWYVYGLLHSPDYRSRYATDLKKVLPRIPLAADFWAFSRAGRELGTWHLHYETVEPWPLDEAWISTAPDLRVGTKMRFGKDAQGKPDRSVIEYNDHLQLRGVPPEAYDYVVNGKSAIEWVMERYTVSTHKDSGIVNDPNLWCDEHEEPRYIVDLLKRVVRVSMETVRIVAALPALQTRHS